MTGLGMLLGAIVVASAIEKLANAIERHGRSNDAGKDASK